jgi:hypothetical protein
MTSMALTALLLAHGGCAEPASPQAEASPTGDPCLYGGTPGATSSCMEPGWPAEYYAEQASMYFDTLDIEASADSIPNYAQDVARWEWPPWLLLTGYGKQSLLDTAVVLRLQDPSTVPVRDCRGFATQPFGRCYVVFEYDEGPCPIYEEFTFNEAGEMTFIEAWSDLPDLRPQEGSDDPWGEHTSLGRLSTRVPGLGASDGTLSLDAPAMLESASSDAEVADFALRATDWATYWFEALAASDEDFFAVGCGW